MRLILLLLLAALACGARSDGKFPSLPKQSAVQKAVVARAAAFAAKFSPAAAVEVLQLLNTSSVRKFLQELDEDAGLHKLPVEMLFRRLFDELGAAELVHNFGEVNDPAYEGNCGFDITTDDGLGPETPYFLNQWMLQSLGIVPVDGANNIFTEKSETEYFGYPPYKNVTNPDLATSTERPIYAALNMFRGAGANAQCGPIAAVFSREYVGTEAVAAPVDTGLYVGACGEKATVAGLGPCSDCINCSSWSREDGRPLGVPGQLEHLLVS
jgi:hypothetical protein